MQIFWPENNYQASAQALDDRRLNKQILELGQILSTAIWIKDCGIAETLTAMKCIYLPSHENHPVIKNCKYYYYEALEYLRICCKEYRYRFHKKHKTSSMLHDFESQAYLFFKYKRRPFINCTTNHKHIISTNDAYGLCLIEKWGTDKTQPKWTNRPRPTWSE